MLVSNKIGIVIPVYNEVKRMKSSYLNEISQIENIHLIFVDDGSADLTATQLSQWFIGRKNVQILSLPCNVGKANAVRFGWLEFLKDESIAIFGFLDVDGAFGTDDIRRCIKLADELLLSRKDSFSENTKFNALWSSRIKLSGRNIVRSRKRFVLGRILAKIIGLFFRDLPWDTQSGMKFFLKSQGFVDIIQSRFENRWLFEIEMHLKLKQVNSLGFKIWEEPLLEWLDVSHSKVNFHEQIRIIREISWLLYSFKVIRRIAHEARNY
jgi:glycosyltransferase involved in cell wall biosynthesis